MEKRQQINPYNPKNKLLNKNDIQNTLKNTEYLKILIIWIIIKKF